MSPYIPAIIFETFILVCVFLECALYHHRMEQAEARADAAEAKLNNRPTVRKIVAKMVGRS